MRKVALFWLALLFLGCAPRGIDKEQIKKMVIDYYTPYTSIEIAKPLSVHVLWIKPVSKNEIHTKVCYQFLFEKSYKELVDYLKKHPNSFTARFDVGLIALFGRKFGNFQKGESKNRCDIVILKRKYFSWVIDRI